ncbi:MAG: sigma-54 dependent transcriptional regulator [Candidatus Eisenbacteria bacterium]
MADQGRTGEHTAILVCQFPDKLAGISQILVDSGVTVHKAADGSAALSTAGKHPPDYVLAYRDLPDSSGMKVIQTLRRKFPLAIAALFGPRLPLEERRSLIGDGADDYIEIDSDVSRVSTSVHRLVARKEIGILGRNEKMLQAIEIVENIARTKVTVLITGESGTGKELIARAIHLRSDRRTGPFIAVNCAALPDGVLESELFGHEKGSFTGATSQRKGRFEIADRGTLLLDEVGEMPLGTQVKLLRVLEEERFMRVGGSQDVVVDVRVVASTNRDLRRLVEDGRFRRDLYYRLNVVPIHLPALRERREDIRTILYGIAEEARVRNNVKFGGVTEDALITLERYDWPGNVRELRNLAESLVVLSGGKKIQIDDLPDHIADRDYVHRDLPVRVGRPREDVERDLLFGRLAEIEHRITQMADVLLDLRDAVTGQTGRATEPSAVPGEVKYTEIPDGYEDIVVKPGTPIRDMERELIEKTLRDVNGNRKKAAGLLGIGERTLYRRMKEYGIG